MNSFNNIPNHPRLQFPRILGPADLPLHAAGCSVVDPIRSLSRLYVSHPRISRHVHARIQVVRNEVQSVDLHISLTHLRLCRRRQHDMVSRYWYDTGL